MKDEIGGVAIEEFIGLKSKVYSTLVSNSAEYKKVKDANKNVVAEITQDEYKEVLLNKKCLTHSINIIQIKNYRVRTYEINKISMSCFDDKIYINFWSNQESFFAKL